MMLFNMEEYIILLAPIQTKISLDLMVLETIQILEEMLYGLSWAIVFNKTGNQILVRVDGENAFTPVDYDSTLNTDVAI